jgi:hypothetical protein
MGVCAVVMVRHGAVFIVVSSGDIRSKQRDLVALLGIRMNSRDSVFLSGFLIDFLPPPFFLL